VVAAHTLVTCQGGELIRKSNLRPGGFGGLTKPAKGRRHSVTSLDPNGA